MHQLSPFGPYFYCLPVSRVLPGLLVSGSLCVGELRTLTKLAWPGPANLLGSPCPPLRAPQVPVWMYDQLLLMGGLAWPHQLLGPGRVFREHTFIWLGGSHLLLEACMLVRHMLAGKAITAG